MKIAFPNIRSYVYQNPKNEPGSQNVNNVSMLTSSLPFDVVSFNGLTKKMKKSTYIDGQKDIKVIVDANKDKNLIVGSLPKFIIDKLPKENRKEAIMDIYNTFDEIAYELRDFDDTKATSISEITNRRYNSTVQKLDNVLRKYNLVGRWDDVDIEYLGKGGKGAGYKIVGLRDSNYLNEDEFVIKVFHVLEGADWQPYKSHGCYAEINSAQYWMSNVGSDTNRGKFFWGSLKSGYMVNKYVDDDVRLPKRVINPYQYGLKCTDEDLVKKHNVCKGYSYDWGGVRVVNRIKNGDKYARRILQDIASTPEEYRYVTWMRYFAKKDSNNSSKNAGLAMGIKYINNKDECIDMCLNLHDKKVDRALAYVLKYLPFDKSVKYFEKLVQTDDVITQVILFNEIPLLAMKHRDKGVKDDLQTVRSEILPSRIAVYYNIAEKYAHPESIEHLASFLHLLPKDKFRSYYGRLAKIHNHALHDRMFYKFPMVENKNSFFAAVQLAKNIDVNDKYLLNKLLSLNLSDKNQEAIKMILDKRIKEEQISK